MELRAWGNFEVLYSGVDTKIKKIIVHPDQRLSLQSHKFRDEHWFIMEGVAEVEINSDKKILTQGFSIDIPREALHRVKNIGAGDLIFIEIQTGLAFNEDDIIRYEDDYGRV